MGKMRIRLLVAVLASLIILSLSPEYHIPHAQKPLYTLVGHYMCLDYNPVNYDAVEITNGFFVLDKQVMCWTRINFSNNVYVHGHFLKWYDPTGELYRTYDVPYLVGPGNVTLTDTISPFIWGMKKGVWTVVAAINGTGLFTDYFTIGDYMITVGVSGIPKAYSTGITLNGIYVGTVQGGQVKKLTITKSPTTVSVDKYADATAETRYYCSENVWANPIGGAYYTFNYTPEYYLTIKSPYDTSKGSGWYAPNTVASFEITSVVDHGNGTRRVFNGWTGNSSASTPSASITMTGPKTVTATWKKQYYLNIVSAYESTQGSGWYDVSATASFNVTSTTVNHGNNTQRAFLGWKGDIESSATSGTILMNSPKTVTVTWKKMYYLTVSSAYSTTNGTGWHDAGAEAKFSVSDTTTRATGIWGILGGKAEFQGWEGDTTANTTSAKIIVDGPKSVTAIWKINLVLPYGILGATFIVVVLVIVYALRRRKKVVAPPPEQPATVLFPSPSGSPSSTPQ